MKINGSTPTGAAQSGRAARPVADGFAAPAVDAPRAAAPSGAAPNVAALGGLGALLALQETLGPVERRRRAIRRAGGLLDALDALKLAVLDPAGLEDASLRQLASTVRDAREATEDPGLEDLLDQIEIRAAVELAKRVPPGAAA